MKNASEFMVPKKQAKTYERTWDAARDPEWRDFIRRCATEAYLLDRSRTYEYYSTLFSEKIRKETIEKYNREEFYRNKEPIDV